MSNLPFTHDDVKRVAQEILNRPEFNPTPPEQDWANPFLKILKEILVYLSQWTQGTNIAFRILVIIVAGIMLYLMGYLVYRVFSGMKRKGITKPSLKTEQSWFMKAPENSLESWHEILGLAHQALKDGDRYRAIWIAHRLFLTLLHQKRLVTFVKWKTNADYLRECPTKESTYETFREITVAYDLIVYAHREVAIDKLSKLLDFVADYLKSK